MEPKPILKLVSAPLNPIPIEVKDSHLLNPTKIERSIGSIAPLESEKDEAI